MKHKIFIISIISIMGILMAASCSKDDSLKNEENVIQANPHTIPLDVALTNLQDFLNVMDSDNTKSGSQYSARKIGKVYTINSSKFSTKGNVGNAQEAVEMVYLVNFKNDEGYALIAADDRISSDVISVVEEGSLTEEELYDDYELSERKLYPEYPLEGPGIVYAEDGSEDMFLNPNTFSLYDENEDDSYVGDFSLFPDEIGTKIIDRESMDDGNNVINYLSIEYAKREIEDGRLRDEQLPDVPTDPDPDPNPNPNPNPEPEPTITTTTYVSTVFEQKVANMLTFASEWHQDSPFNDFFPIVRKWILVGATTRAGSGCVPLALAMIMAYHEFPSEITYNNKSVDWTELKKNIKKLSSTGKQSAAALLKNIAESCHSLYFYKGTFTLPSSARNFLSRLSYNNVEYKNYNTSDVITMLENDCPVFICSVPHKGGLDYDLANSHGWTIDGYKTKYITTTTTYYTDGIYDREVSSTSSVTMVHCNFGWGGDCNGYFTSGIFDLTGIDVEFDGGHKEKTNYNWYLKIITYDKPRQ